MTTRGLTADPLDVAFVLSLPYPAVPGGAERWFAETARALAEKARVQVHYLVPRGRAMPTALDADTPGLAVRTHRCVALGGRHGDRLALAPSVFRAASAAQVVHVNQFGSATAQALAALAKLRGASTFVTDHGSSGVALGTKVGASRLFDGFLEVSKFAGQHTPPAKTRVVYGGVDTDAFKPGERAEEPFALYVGRLMPHKGVDWLV